MVESELVISVMRKIGGDATIAEHYYSVLRKDRGKTMAAGIGSLFSRIVFTYSTFSSQGSGFSTMCSPAMSIVLPLVA